MHPPLQKSKFAILGNQYQQQPGTHRSRRSNRNNISNINNIQLVQSSVLYTPQTCTISQISKSFANVSMTALKKNLQKASWEKKEEKAAEDRYNRFLRL